MGSVCGSISSSVAYSVVKLSLSELSRELSGSEILIAPSSWAMSDMSLYLVLLKRSEELMCCIGRGALLLLAPLISFPHCSQGQKTCSEF